MLARGGWFGRYLHVDVESGRHHSAAIADSLLQGTIGGVGLGTALLLNQQSAHRNALEPASPIVFCFSPMVGTSITTSAKLAVLAKSPLTHRLTDALSSSDFAVFGKRTGHDAIVISGKASTPSVLLIDEAGARTVPCPELWNRKLRIESVDAALRDRHPGFCFAVIGAAGEHQVHYASISNQGRHAGRGGLGAVLGSKNIKAVGVAGHKTIGVAAPDELVDIARDLAKRSLGPATEKYRELGTVANLAAFNRIAALPTRNFQQSTFEGAEALSGERLAVTRARGRSACRNCTIGCEHFFATSRGGDERPVKLEYESLFSLGPLCGISDPDVTLAASRKCDDLGLDTISTGATIAFAMECHERRLFDTTLATYATELGLGFGNGSSLLALIDAIATRSDPLADLLADGSRAAAERIGGGARAFAPHVKGLEIPGYEPRAMQTMALGFAVNTRGADHNKSGAYEVDLSGTVDRFAPTTAAITGAVETEDRAALIDSLILCKFLRAVFPDIYQESANALRAVTGHPFDAQQLRDTAARIVLLKRLFNERAGWSRAEDTLPERFLREKLPTGASKGAVIDEERLEQLIDAYYQARGLTEDGRLRPAVVTRLEALLAAPPGQDP